MAVAMAEEYDHLLWVNDDTRLHPDAVATLLRTHDTVATEGRPAIVVGSICDPETGVLTYGGVYRPSTRARLHYERVQRANEPRACETMNGNCVLIPAEVARAVGNLDEGFVHGMGDYDYGHRARALGFTVWNTAEFTGECRLNRGAAPWNNTELPLRRRWQLLVSPKGLPPKGWRVFTRRHTGPLWFVYWASPYARVLLSSLRRRGAAAGGRAMHSGQGSAPRKAA